AITRWTSASRWLSSSPASSASSPIRRTRSATEAARPAHGRIDPLPAEPPPFDPLPAEPHPFDPLPAEPHPFARSALDSARPSPALSEQAATPCEHPVTIV